MPVVNHRDHGRVLAHVFDRLRIACGGPTSNIQETENIVFEGVEPPSGRIHLGGAPTRM